MGFADECMAILKGDNLEVRNDDDRIDRLNYRWTVVLLILFAGLVTAETYIMTDKIKCWAPAHFKGAWEEYVNDYCWVKNTYYLPWDEHVPLDLPSRDRFPIVYYQWVPLFLLVQAIFFYFPIQLWRMLNNKTGIDVNDIVEASERFQRASEQKMIKTWKTTITQQFHSYLVVSIKPHDPNDGPCKACNCNMKWFLSIFCLCCMGRRFGNYMSILYIIIKLLFVANSVGQLFILNWFLGRNFNMYGIDLIKSWITGKTLAESPYFPRVTFCDVEIRRLGNMHRYTVQCVLPINMFNEKIYAFLWFWFFFVAAISTFSLFQWIVRMTSSKESYRYISRRLGFNPQKDKAHLTKTNIEKFITDYLRSDGVLVVRLIDDNTNKFTADDIVGPLFYQKYLKIKEQSAPDEQVGSLASYHPKDPSAPELSTPEKVPLLDDEQAGSSVSSDSDNIAAVYPLLDKKIG